MLQIFQVRSTTELHTGCRCDAGAERGAARNRASLASPPGALHATALRVSEEQLARGDLDPGHTQLSISIFLDPTFLILPFHTVSATPQILFRRTVYLHYAGPENILKYQKRIVTTITTDLLKTLLLWGPGPIRVIQGS